MIGREPPLVADPAAITADWLTDVLRFSGAIDAGTTVAGFTPTPVGTGQVGAIVRFQLDYVGGAGPASVIGKFASRDPESASIGVLTRTYETEVEFYTRLAQTVDIVRPRCHFAAVEPGTANVVVVLDDLAPAVQGDQIAGCTEDQAALAVEQAARLHGPRWGDADLAEHLWLVGRTSLHVFEGFRAIWEAFVARYRTMLEDVTLEQGERMLSARAGLAPTPPEVVTVVHNDFRLDNMLFDHGPDRPPITVVDWQTVGVGRGPGDVAYFLGQLVFRSGRPPGLRRAAGGHLLRGPAGVWRHQLRPGGVLGRLPAVELRVAAHGGVRVDARRTNRARRPDVHGHGQSVGSVGGRRRRRHAHHLSGPCGGPPLRICVVVRGYAPRRSARPVGAPGADR